MTPAEFRTTPIGIGFADVTTYPDSSVQFWLDMAGRALDANRFTDDFIDLATILYVAHFLALDSAATRGAASGAPGIGVSGVVASKSVGTVSLSYNTTIGLDQDAGAWNLTSYGVRLWQFIKLAGMGGVQL